MVSLSRDGTLPTTGSSRHPSRRRSRHNRRSLRTLGLHSLCRRSLCRRRSLCSHSRGLPELRA